MNLSLAGSSVPCLTVGAPVWPFTEFEIRHWINADSATDDDGGGGGGDDGSGGGDGDVLLGNRRM